MEIQKMKDDPIDEFNEWVKEALAFGMIEANAMTLATVGPDGRPSLRIMLLKEITPGGLIFYTNYKSRKGIEITQNDHVALLFFWRELERQVRIEGRASRIPETESTEYFQQRPKGSQIGAWVSQQSLEISGRLILEEKQARLTVEYKDDKVLPKPDDWGGYIVVPQYYEFWQGRENRLHDRIAYKLKETTQHQEWIRSRLAP